MTFTQAVIYTGITLLLTACNHLPNNSSGVNRQDLLHSMFYTHRNLANIALHPQPNTERKTLFALSHCDLIIREVVNADTSHCPTHDTKTDSCIATFHRCIGNCPDFKHDCLPCEQQALNCLSDSESYEENQ